MQKSKLAQRAEGARKFMSKIHLALTRYNLRVASALIERPVLLKPGCWRQRTASFCSECVSRLAYYSVRTGRTSARRPYLLAFWCDSRLPSSRGKFTQTWVCTKWQVASRYCPPFFGGTAAWHCRLLPGYWDINTARKGSYLVTCNVRNETRRGSWECQWDRRRWIVFLIENLVDFRGKLPPRWMH